MTGAVTPPKSPVQRLAWFLGIDGRLLTQTGHAPPAPISPGTGRQMLDYFSVDTANYLGDPNAPLLAEVRFGTRSAQVKATARSAQLEVDGIDNEVVRVRWKAQPGDKTVPLEDLGISIGILSGINQSLKALGVAPIETGGASEIVYESLDESPGFRAIYVAVDPLHLTDGVSVESAILGILQPYSGEGKWLEPPLLEVSGRIRFKNRTGVWVRLTAPQTAFQGSIDTSDGPVAFHRFMEDLDLGSALWPQNLRIAGLSLEYAPPRKVFGLALDGQWDLLPGLALQHIGAGVKIDGQTTQADFNASLMLFAGTGYEFAIDLSARLETKDHSRILRFQGAQAPEYSFRLGALVADLLSASGTHLPLPKALAKLAVSDLAVECEVSKDSTGPSSTSLAVSFELSNSGGNWDVLPGLLSFAPATIQLARDATGVSAVIRDTATVFQAPWDVVVNLPKMAGTLQLAAPVDLAEVFRHFHLPTQHLEALRVSTASADFNAEERSAKLDLKLEHWKPEQWLELSDVTFHIDYQGGEKGGAAGSLSAKLLFNSTEMAVQAEHPGPGMGWRFRGELKTKLGLQSVFDKFGLKSEVVDSLGQPDVHSLCIAYDTTSKHLELHCEIQITDRAVLHLSVDRKPVIGETMELRFGGKLSIESSSGPVEFDVLFDKHGAGKQLIACYSDPGGGRNIIQDLIGAFSKDPVPDLTSNLQVHLKDAVLIYDLPAAKKDKRRLLLAFDLDASVDLSGLGNLPLIGKAFTGSERLQVAFSPLVATQPFSKEELQDIKKLLPGSAPVLPEVVGAGTELQLNIQLGDLRLNPTIDLKAQNATTEAVKDAPNPITAKPAPRPSPQPANTTWIDVQRTLAKVLTLRRIGVGLQKSKLSILLDGSIQVACLELDLLGLGASYDLSSKSLSFALYGMGLDFKKGALEVGAAFVNFDGDFVGRAVLRMPSFGLSALGAFKMMDDGQPSMFLYGVLTAPLGGPVFFFVEGLAAGFGYNRHLMLPPISGVRSFPFVQEAIAPPDRIDVDGELNAIRTMIYPSTGEYFLAAGIKFNSFRQLDCFALLTLQIDLHRGRCLIGLMGVGSLQIPRGSPLALCFIEIAFLVTVDPLEGVILASAELTPASYVYNPTCHLVGGIGAGLWFKGDHAGDFVYSIGGYHPHFPVPAHYPMPPRAGLRWGLSDNFWVKGEMYCAFTPVAAMAGGRLEANWHSGDLTASFVLGADFLIQFKPLHYEADAYLEIHVGYTLLGIHIDACVDARLDIWGPDFSGTAHFHAGPIKFSVDFGGAGRHAPQPIGWSEFVQSFLPPSEKLKQSISAAVTEGLVRVMRAEPGDHASGGQVYSVSSKKFGLLFGLAVPVTDLGATPCPADFGVAPMNRSDVPIKSLVTYQVTRDGKDCTGEFQFEPRKKAFPAGMWGKGFQSPGSVSTIQAIGEVAVSALQEPFPGRSAEIVRKNLDYDIGKSPQRDYTVPFSPVTGLGPWRTQAQWRTDRNTIQAKFTDPDVAKVRAGVLEALQIDAARAVSLSSGWAGCLVVPPQVRQDANPVPQKPKKEDKR